MNKELVIIAESVLDDMITILTEEGMPHRARVLLQEAHAEVLDWFTNENIEWRVKND